MTPRARPRLAAGGLGLALAVLTCKTIGVDLDAVVAIEVSLPDSGIVEEADTIVPRARALNGHGDSVTATIVWGTLDATLSVLDTLTGATLGVYPGTGRLQARVGALRSQLLTVTIRAQADTVFAVGDRRDTVVVGTPDSLSDSLTVRLQDLTTGATPANLVGRRVVFRLVYPSGAGAFTLVPGDTVVTGSTGEAVVQVRLVNRVLPDSAVVEASAVRATGAPVPGSPVTFVVEFLP